MSVLKYNHLPYQECPGIFGCNLKAAIILVKCIIRKSQPRVTATESDQLFSHMRKCVSQWHAMVTT